jgi:Right handed beta helix region
VLIGDGREKSSLVLSSAATDSLITATASIELHGLRIDGASGPTAIDLVVFQGDTGDFVMRECLLVDPKANGLRGLRINHRFMIQGCDFRFRGTGAYPSIFIYIGSATTDGGTICINDNTFYNPRAPATPGPGAIMLIGKTPDSTGGTQGVSADLSGNYFFQMGTNYAGGHPLGCIDIYDWVGRTTITRNRMYKPLYSAVKIANAAGVVISENIVAEAVYTASGAAALFYSGYINHPGVPYGPFHNVVIANNVVRNHSQGAGIHLASDTTDPSNASLRHEIIGNIIDAATSGIQLDGVGNVLIADNLICNCTGTSIYDGGVRMARITSGLTEQGEITVRGCTFLNNGGYGVFGDGDYDNSSLRITVSDCLFYSKIAPYHIRLQSSVGKIASANMVDNRFRGTPGAVQVVRAGTLWMHGNMADNNAISITGPVTTLLHGENSWDATVFKLTTSLAPLASWTGSVTLPGANVGDTVSVGYDGFPNGLLGGGVVSTGGTVQLTLFNAGPSFGPTMGNVRVSTSRQV